MKRAKLIHLSTVLALLTGIVLLVLPGAAAEKFLARHLGGRYEEVVGN